VTQSTNGQTTDAAVGRPQRLARRRSRILRNIVLLGLLGVVYALVVVWHRDTAHRNTALDAAEAYRGTVQAALDASGWLPLVLPKTGPGGRTLPAKGFAYLPVDDIRVLRAFDGPVVLGFSPRVANTMQTSGRAVLICDQRQCRVEWLTNTEFVERITEQKKRLETRQRRLLERGPAFP